MATAAEQPRELSNRLLSQLGSNGFRNLTSRLEDLTLRSRQVLYEPNEPPEYVYFPAGAVVSLVTVMRDGTAVETATIGYEGMVGVVAVLGVGNMYERAFCQIPGPAKRLPRPILAREVDRSPVLRRLLSRYMQGLIVQFTQGVACNRLHSVEQRCARWLLTTHDSVGTDSFPLTQEFLAGMLGVRRATVSVVAGRLQKAGLITYHHGTVTIRDRGGLKARACECCDVIETEFERIFATRAPATNPRRRQRSD
jgi:CRP-like cAMP-binding protein